MTSNNIRLVLCLLALDFALMLFAIEVNTKHKIERLQFIAQLSSPPVRHIQNPNAAQSLGGEIFEKGKNPILDKLPSTNPTEGTNPIRELYKNPFE